VQDEKSDSQSFQNKIIMVRQVYEALTNTYAKDYTLYDLTV